MSQPSESRPPESQPSDEANAKRRRFRELLHRDEILVMPGGFSPVLAKMAQDVGFEAYFLAGSQLSAFLYGYPDVGVLGLRDVVDHARHMAARTDIPVLMDFDTGYGNAVSTWYAVQEGVRSGAAGLQIEDQEAPKKSGTTSGRKCISRAEAVGKYRAAVAARDEIDGDFVITARCDALGAQDETFETALDRCVAYAEEGGADLVWLNSVQTREQLERACARVPVPVLTIWGGEGPSPTPQEFHDLGVKVALYPTIAASAALDGAWYLLNDFKDRGAPALADWASRMAGSPHGGADFRTLSAFGRVRELEERFLPPEAQRDYASTWGHRETLTAKQP
ncbi:isocitrate lyase/PEP mutase family protein [Actinocorallia sp. A-T 12471]|uniref:isocitrate lyase/PEP mutase family protein n=1 Tax=Actinocorallia sp. A-T 12471 TaxID=3089813 RepID=UPI0029D0A1B5|nr:isocitrate lyase/PEP mutase family protein [Actinocorallia sp. A-T 12471]MDX6740622.1 isocitrate lyase/PEP mutase family protein [Actinocorallia sp. A-T 12471]